MDFTMGLTKIKKKNESLIVVVDNLSKVEQFILIKSIYKEVHIANILLKEIFILHGIRKAIISDRDMNFTRNNWRSLFSFLET